MMIDLASNFMVDAIMVIKGTPNKRRVTISPNLASTKKEINTFIHCPKDTDIKEIYSTLDNT